MSNINLIDFQLPFTYLDERTKALLEGRLIEDFIGEDGHIIKCDKLSYIGQGVNSSVWKYEKDGKVYAFKTFFEEHYDYALKYDVYRKMKNLPLKNITKAEEAYKKMSSKGSEMIDAYLMKYLSIDENFSILEYPLDFLLESLSNLEEDIEILSNNHIFMRDIKPANSVVNNEDNMFYITDVDMFTYNSKYHLETFLRQNKIRLISLVKQLFLQEVKGLTEIDSDKRLKLQFLLNNYYSIDSLKDGSITVGVSDMFKSYEKPKQYFLDR